MVRVRVRVRVSVRVRVRVRALICCSPGVTHLPTHPPFRNVCRPIRKELSAAVTVTTDEMLQRGHLPSDEFHQPPFISEQVSLDERSQKVHFARLSPPIETVRSYLSVVVVSVR